MAKHIPMRMCVACRQMKPKSELIRLVPDGENEAILDKTQKIPARGVYLCRDAQCINLAKKKKLLERSFGTDNCSGLYMQASKAAEENG